MKPPRKRRFSVPDIIVKRLRNSTVASSSTWSRSRPKRTFGRMSEPRPGAPWTTTVRSLEHTECSTPVLHDTVAVDLVCVAAVANGAVEFAVARDERAPGPHLHVQARRPGVCAPVRGRALVGRAGDETFGPRLPLVPPRAADERADRGPVLFATGTAGRTGDTAATLAVCRNGVPAVWAAPRFVVAVTHGSHSGDKCQASFSIPEPGPPFEIAWTPVLLRTPKYSLLFT